MKNRYFSIAVFVICIFFSCFSFVYGVEGSITKEQELKSLQREDVTNSINDLTEKIRKKVTDIDKKIESLKDLEEYNNYPAIRLNIDTPMFGLKSMVNQRLQIIRGVSTADVASGYSIRDILVNNKVKIPDSQIAGITVSTRDVVLDENIDFLDANIVIHRLTEYLEKLDLVDEFLDKQINKIFSGYINKQKKEDMASIVSRLNDLDKRLLEIDNKLMYVYLLDQESSKYSEYVKKYDEINDKVNKEHNILNNIIISNTELEAILRETVSLEAEVLDFSKEVNDEYEVGMKNINLENSLKKVKANMEYRKSRIGDYVKNSTEKIEKKEENTEAEENKEESETVIEEIVKYEVVSEETLVSLTSIIEQINNNLEKITANKPNEEIMSEEVANKEEVDSVNVKELTKEEKQKIIEETKALYEEYLIRENKFYLDNVNYLLKDTSNKLSALAKNTDTNVVKQIKYIYLDLPNKLNDYLTSKNLNSKIDLSFVINKLHDDLLGLSKTNTNITEIYSEKIS